MIRYITDDLEIDSDDSVKKIQKKNKFYNDVFFEKAICLFKAFWKKVDVIFERVYISNIASWNECWNLFWESNLYTESSVLLWILRKSIL